MLPSRPPSRLTYREIASPAPPDSRPSGLVEQAVDDLGEALPVAALRDLHPRAGLGGPPQRRVLVEAVADEEAAADLVPALQVGGGVADHGALGPVEAAVG